MIKKIIFIGGCIIIAVIIYINFFMPTPVYLYIDEVYTDDHNIIIYVNDGSGHYKYRNYDLIELENGIYQIQGYGSLLLGDTYPVTITILDNDGIKEIKQKNLDDQLETIYKK